MEVFRGSTKKLNGYKSDRDIQLLVPSSERHEDFIFWLKAGDTPLSALNGNEINYFLVVETVFDTFVSAYGYGLSALLKRSQIGARTIEGAGGIGYKRRRSTDTWESAHSLVLQARRELQEAHSIHLGFKTPKPQI
jgi:hypothetical protein